MTGDILDYEVLSIFCQECSIHGKDKNDSEQYVTWKENHKQHCSINFEGSSGAMEASGVARIFECSVELRKLKYTTFVGDGDSSTCQTVSNRIKERCDDRCSIKKESVLDIFKKGWEMHCVVWYMI